mmetsp:Transcript_147288/g.367253  ORF Transcript_147288/g.367253 Transcript_147288/m.367253 type:complete len:270 (+) Transcript_147288:1198-2007(+)
MALWVTSRSSHRSCCLSARKCRNASRKLPRCYTSWVSLINLREIQQDVRAKIAQPCQLQPHPQHQPWTCLTWTMAHRQLQVHPLACWMATSHPLLPQPLWICWRLQRPQQPPMALPRHCWVETSAAATCLILVGALLRLPPRCLQHPQEVPLCSEACPWQARLRRLQALPRRLLPPCWLAWSSHHRTPVTAVVAAAASSQACTWAGRVLLHRHQPPHRPRQRHPRPCRGSLAWGPPPAALECWVPPALCPEPHQRTWPRHNQIRIEPLI